MKDPKQYLTDAIVTGECLHTPGAVQFSIDEAKAGQIRDLQRLVVAHDLDKVIKSDPTAWFLLHHPEQDPEEGEEEGEGNVVRTECDRLVVTSEDFWFEAYVKHSDVTCSSEKQAIFELMAHFGMGDDERLAWPGSSGRRADRKSTRLNSSHHSISYAV